MQCVGICRLGALNVAARRSPPRVRGTVTPTVQRRPALLGILAHPGGGGARRRARAGLGIRPGPGRAAGDAGPAFQQACRTHRGRRRGQDRGGRARAGDLQGTGGSARGPHPGRERRPRQGRAVHLHAARSRGRRRPRAGSASGDSPVRRGVREAAHPRRGRRPAHAPPRARRAHHGGLRGPGHRRAGRNHWPHPRREAAARPARPHAPPGPAAST